MTAHLRTFRGHFDFHSRRGERRVMVTVALDRESGDAFLEALGPQPHRSRSIPIAMAIGDAARTLPDLVQAPTEAVPGTGLTPVAGAAFAQAVRRMVDLAVQLSHLTDLANAEPDLVRKGAALDFRDTTASHLDEATAALDAIFRSAIAGAGR